VGGVAVWFDIDSPNCRRTLTPERPVSGYLSFMARLMRDAIIDWDWNRGGATA